jgi:hypothetical protein
MRKLSINALILALTLIAPALYPLRIAAAPVQDAQSGAAKASSFLGTVQSIDGKLLTVKSDAGATMQITVQDNARLLRVEPGQRSLQGASPLNLPDLQVGDRVLARGAISPDGKQLAAAMLVAIKKADIAQKQEEEREDWQKHGVGGLVQSVDPAAGTVAISLPGKRTLAIQTTKQTVIRRYAPGSVKFDDAKPSTLTEIKPGDQLRARGAKSTDGQSFSAEEIVSGSFRNIAGQVVAVDPAALTLTLTDLATKRPVVVHITSDTQLKKLDPMVAQRLAARLRGGGPNPGGGNRSAGPASGPGSHPGAGPGSGPGAANGAAPDPQQFLARAPSATLKDFAKGNAVMLVATEGASSGPLTAVTVVGGVEPMLQASTRGSQAMLSSAWNLNAGGGDSGGGEGAAPQ